MVLNDGCILVMYFFNLHRNRRTIHIQRGVQQFVRIPLKRRHLIPLSAFDGICQFLSYFLIWPESSLGFLMSHRKLRLSNNRSSCSDLGH